MIEKLETAEKVLAFVQDKVARGEMQFERYEGGMVHCDHRCIICSVVRHMDPLYKNSMAYIGGAAVLGLPLTEAFNLAKANDEASYHPLRKKLLAACGLDDD